MFLLRLIHTASILLTTLGVSVGFVCGVLYLVQDRRLRQKMTGDTRFRLPTLEWSRVACRRAIGVSLAFLGTCIFSGVLLQPKLFFFGDPLVLGTLAMFAFLLLFSGVLTAKFDKQEGRRVAFLTLISFLFLLTILLFAVFYRDVHWKKTPYREPGTAAPITRGQSPALFTSKEAP